MALRAPNLGSLDPAVLLRVGLGFVLLYAGTLAVVDASVFTHLVPPWLFPLLAPGAAVTAQGIVSLALGVVLLVGVWTPGAALLTTLDLAVVIICYGIDETTFTLAGLMFASLALFTLALHPREKETAA